MRIGALLAGAVLLALGACLHAPPASEEPIHVAADAADASAAAPRAEVFGPLARLAGTRWKEVPGPDSSGFADKMSDWSLDLGATVLVKRSVSHDGRVASLTYLQADEPGKGADGVVVTNWGEGFDLPFTFYPDGSWSVPEATTAAGAAETRSRGRIDEDGTMVAHTELHYPEGWKPVAEMRMTRTDDPLPEVKRFAPKTAPIDFGPLDRLVGTRWRGEPGESDKEHGQPADYSEWYKDLGGSVLVNRHVLEDGSYGGVTLVFRHRVTNALVFNYITSAGFRTSGSFTLNEDGTWSAEEDLEGLPHIDKVRSTGRINEDGTMSSVSEFHGADGWTPGHTFVYTRTDEPLPELVPTGVPE